MHTLRSANLCWGQRYHWFRYQLVPPGSRHEAHITGSLQLPAGLTVPRIKALLDHMAVRHEVMRTVYDGDALPWPKQRVLPPGALPLRVASTERDGTPVPAKVIRELIETDFDLARDWPVRACVVTTEGVPKRLTLVFNHLAFDDRSLDVLRRELEATLDALGSDAPAALGPVLEQPVDVARREAAIPESRIEQVLRPWQAELERRNADVFASRRRRPHDPPPEAPAGPASFSASLTSPVLLECARSIAERMRVWPAAVHLAAYAAALAAYTGEELISSRIYTSQRETDDLAGLMTCMSFPALVTVEAGGDPGFGELVRRAAAGIEQAMARSRVPYDRVVELTAHEATRRGRQLRVGSEVNFLSNAPHSCGTSRERFAWNAEPTAWATSGSDSYFRIYEWSDGLTLALQATAAVMDKGAVEAFLRGCARLLEAHRDPEADLRLSEAVRLMDFPSADSVARRAVRVGTDYVDLDATEELLASHANVASAHVATDAAGRLVADVAAEGPLTAAELRTHVLGRLDEYPASGCPDWFRLVTLADPAAPPTEGDGLDSAVPLPDSGDESARALVKVVAEVNRLDRVNPADCYTVAGGRALRGALVLSRLEELGWRGVSMDGLCGIRPLAALASRMERSTQP